MLAKALNASNVLVKFWGLELAWEALYRGAGAGQKSKKRAAMPPWRWPALPLAVAAGQPGAGQASHRPAGQAPACHW
jgi:hypothetical protein